MEQKRVIALGFFDGVHLGHGRLLEEAVRLARAQGFCAAALTFDRHPDAVIRGEAVRLLSSPQEREDLMRRIYGIDEVLFLHFDSERMAQPWQDFVLDTLLRQYHAAHVVCGENFRFGYRGAGTPEALRQLCAAYGVGCTVIPSVLQDGSVISSTRIRQLLSQGELAAATRCLGHRHCFTGTVSHGAHLGTTLGFPTANLLVPEEILPPKFGVYVTQVFVDGRAYDAMTNVGLSPTVDAQLLRIESHLLDYHGDLYGKRIRVEFVAPVRPEQRFESLAALRAQLRQDLRFTQDYCSRLPHSEVTDENANR